MKPIGYYLIMPLTFPLWLFLKICHPKKFNWKFLDRDTEIRKGEEK